MSRKLQDQFFRKAKEAGFVARSAYKLTEIQQRYRVIQREGNVLDLGCSPGAWLQVASQYTKGLLVGVDLKIVDLPASLRQRSTTILQSDATTLREEDLRHICPGFGTVLSDMCHSTLGIASADAARSLSLAEAAASLALGSSFADADSSDSADSSRNGVLMPGGNLVVKLLEGGEIASFNAQLKACFAKVKHVRPQATRQQSREIYLVGLGRRMA